MRTRSATALLCGAALLVPGQASAQDDGVFVDPDSPAGREYAIPGEEAREHADPGRRDGRRGSSTPPAFGAGVGDRDGGGDDGAGGGPGGGGSDGGPGGDSGSGGGASGYDDAAEDAPATGDARRALQAATANPTPDGGSGTLLAIGGGGALVLLIGAGGGLLARRRGRAS
jgi:hypothetical protein